MSRSLLCSRSFRRTAARVGDPVQEPAARHQLRASGPGPSMRFFSFTVQSYGSVVPFFSYEVHHGFHVIGRRLLEISNAGSDDAETAFFSAQGRSLVLLELLE